MSEHGKIEWGEVEDVGDLEPSGRLFGDPGIVEYRGTGVVRATGARVEVRYLFDAQEVREDGADMPFDAAHFAAADPVK